MRQYVAFNTDYIWCIIRYMLESNILAARSSPPSRGIAASDVERAADQLLRAGSRPTIEKIRAALGGGSPNTINPLLDVWWKKLSTRLDSGPAALHRLPESVAHAAEALWMQALDEGRRRARLELKSVERSAADQQQSLAVRSHVLSLREGELDSRLRDRENMVAALTAQLREVTLMLRRERASRDAQARRIAALESDALTDTRPDRARRAPGKRRSSKATRRKKNAKTRGKALKKRHS
jgi:hypothetical protein